MFTLLEIQWPPPVYEMPTYVPFDSSSLEVVADILKGTMKSVSNTGLLIMGVLISFKLVFAIVGGFLRHKFAVSDGVRRNELRREIGNLDMKRNSGSIAVNREMNMHMNFLARQLYHKFHREDEIEEGIYKRELAHEVDQRIKEKHPEWAIEKRMESAEAERQYREQARQQRLEDFIRRTKEKDEFEAALRQQNRDRAAQRIVQSRLDSMEADKILRTEHREELVNNRAEGIAISRAAKIRYQQMQEEDHQAQAAAQLKASMRAQETQINPVTGEITPKPHRRRRKKR